jgi:sugar fermentation stimulation protein A
LLPASVRGQPNRFTVTVEPGWQATLDLVPTYLSNTGNLRAILRPGAQVLVTPATGAHRKLPYTLVLAKQWGRWVAVDANLAPKLLAEALEEDRLPGFRGWRLERREPAVEGGRLDLLLRRGGRRLWLEAKCTTLVVNGVARFPNPATERGRRHLRTLTEMVRAGEQAAVCFVAQRSDGRRFGTLPRVDPEFADLLAEARAAGVRCHAYRCRVSPRGVRLWDEIPVLDP